MIRPLFVIKNGLSALIMAALWRSRFPGQPFRYFFDDDERHRSDVATVVARLTPRRRVKSPLDVSGDDIVFATTSRSATTVAFMNRASFGERVLVEHGMAELWRAIGAVRGSEQPLEASAFVTLFPDELRGYLARNGLAPPYSIESAPFDDFRALVRSRFHIVDPIEGGTPRSLFLVQPLLERGAISAAALGEAIEAFLARRDSAHYVIKDHPERSPATIALFTRHLDSRGLSHEELPGDTGMIELTAGRLGCTEMSTFYSTGAMVCGQLYGTSYDTMLPELVRFTDEMSPQQKRLVQLLGDFFNV
jgi:hypothetical protein